MLNQTFPCRDRILARSMLSAYMLSLLLLLYSNLHKGIVLHVVPADPHDAPQHKTEHTRKAQLLENDAPMSTIPIVLTGLNYQMGRGASAKTIPFLCERNDRLVILSNVAQPQLGGCVDVVDISETYQSSISEFPWREGDFNWAEKVFFDRWYVLRDWMRATNTTLIMTMDSDVVMTKNITSVLRKHWHIFSRHAMWIPYAPPASCWNVAFLSLEFLDDITSFWATLFQPYIWFDVPSGAHWPNDMIALGHYVHMAVGKPYPCFAADSQFPGSSRNAGDCDSPYGMPAVLERLIRRNVTAKFKPGTLLLDETLHPTILEIGAVDKNYHHDEYDVYELKDGRKQIRFVNGDPQLKLKPEGTGWMKLWAYILEDALEDCTDFHLHHIRARENCTCSNFCCEDCLPITKTLD